MKFTYDKRDLHIAILSLSSIVLHVFLRFNLLNIEENTAIQYSDYPLFLTLLAGGVPLVFDLTRKLLRREFGSDLLAGISIVTAILLQEYLAASLVVLMLSGGEAIEAFAIRKASSVLEALAKRMPTMAHKTLNGTLIDTPLNEIMIGDVLEVFPHEICPVDGTVIKGHGVMDESYLTGEPYSMSKAPGSQVLSGSINGDSTLTIQADKLALNSRYAKIMEVMRESEQKKPNLRRLGDTLGAFYTPVALIIAFIAWFLSGEAIRFLAVLVVATPCPLLIAIPTAIVGAISLSARRGILIKNPAILEQADLCKTIIFDKTGTLTYGQPKLVKEELVEPWEKDKVLQLVASVERYSKHPLASAILEKLNQRNLSLLSATSISEKPGEGLKGIIDEYTIEITSRKKIVLSGIIEEDILPAQEGGLECMILINNHYVATYKFRDEPRMDGSDFIKHLSPQHGFSKIMLVSGDRESEVSFLAERVGIKEVYAQQSPEQKLAIVHKERALAPTIFIGDGINDAPALTAATVGIALGQNSDITSEAADAIILDSSLEKIDEFFHISRRMRHIALQSAVGGMSLSVIGMGIAAFGYLTPVAGALFQEAIDVFAVLNALRVAFPPSKLSDLKIKK